MSMYDIKVCGFLTQLWDKWALLSPKSSLFIIRVILFYATMLNVLA